MSQHDQYKEEMPLNLNSSKSQEFIDAYSEQSSAWHITYSHSLNLFVNLVAAISMPLTSSTGHSETVFPRKDSALMRTVGFLNVDVLRK